MTYSKDKRLYTFPDWAIAVGWVISLVPLITLPLLVFYNLVKFRRQGRSWRELFRLQPKWPSYDRHMAEAAAASAAVVVRDPDEPPQPPSPGGMNGSSCYGTPPSPMYGVSTVSVLRWPVVVAP